MSVSVERLIHRYMQAFVSKQSPKAVVYISKDSVYFQGALPCGVMGSIKDMMKTHKKGLDLCKQTVLALRKAFPTCKAWKLPTKDFDYLAGETSSRLFPLFFSTGQPASLGVFQFELMDVDEVEAITLKVMKHLGWEIKIME